MTNPAISLATDWQLASTVVLPAVLKEWLLEPASLTARLKSRACDFKLQVLQQQEQTLPDFIKPLLPGNNLAQCREVLMSCNRLPCIYAQSWLPLPTLAALQPLAQLGEKPLGEVIFQQPHVRRSEIEVARVKLTHPLTAAVASGEYWARRSVFTLAGQPLLVAEVFLDGVLAL
ncbi:MULTISPECIES: chorismate--pyruvate lyase family protein [unclassified Arsukibacterium]|uniref:chorismate--pyruvate lyase family protein n=1 Tax=unclassified Arsukibacterium TaxID=2635278 RepID=UPI000C40B13C|nr:MULTISPECIES: chorismate lyase [unclassified Arsukibacterium]MAA93285.1 chorismate--pyruvate lyase [Rheinheimera sp.]MBM34223.1 chorismate--pyruvate lyase [Rheinheimera sp.]HAW92222.1 chorismate lyase [Candidatus Azambacteria bacterium]